MSPSDRRIDRATRLIAAPANRIYEAWIDESAVAKWLPPKGARGVVEAFEPKPGGAFHITLFFDDPGSSASGKTTDNSDVVRGAFVDLVPGERVVQRFVFESADPAFAGTMTMIWTLAAAEGGTEVSVTALDVPAGIRPEDHQVGLESSLANLAAYVE